MKSLASVAMVLLAATAGAQEPPPGAGPRGTSQVAAGEVRHDAVVRASAGSASGVSVSGTDLPVGSVAEVTAIASGRVILAMVTAADLGAPVVLSNAAAQALGIAADTQALVRVRSAVATAQEAVALRTGSAAPTRADAPPALLAALRRRVAPEKVELPIAASTRPPKPVAERQAPARLPTRGASRQAPAQVSKAVPIRSGYVVQVAAFSSAANASAAARPIGGSVVKGPPLWRVRLGPFATTAEAERARATVAKRGYATAQIIRYP